MKAIQLDYVTFARIPKRDRIGEWPQYRVMIPSTPGGFGAGYTDVVVLKTADGWQLLDRTWHRPLVDACFQTRNDAAAQLHHCEEHIPENVRAYLAEVAS